MWLEEWEHVGWCMQDVGSGDKVSEVVKILRRVCDEGQSKRWSGVDSVEQI